MHTLAEHAAKHSCHTMPDTSKKQSTTLPISSVVYVLKVFILWENLMHTCTSIVALNLSHANSALKDIMPKKSEQAYGAA